MNRSIFTKAVHAGDDHSRHHGALSVPIYPASVFAFPDADEGAAIHNEEKPGYYYGRLGNPTQEALENAVAELEYGRRRPRFCIRYGRDIGGSSDRLQDRRSYRCTRVGLFDNYEFA